MPQGRLLPNASPELRFSLDTENRFLVAFGQKMSPVGVEDGINKCGMHLLRFTEAGAIEAAFIDGKAFINVNSSNFKNAQDCSMSVVSVLPASLDRTTVVGTVTSGPVTYPFLARFWNLPDRSSL